MSHFDICLAGIFSTLLITPKPKNPKIIFQWAGLEKLGYEHAFKPYTYSLRSFSKRGGRRPILYIDSDPPAFIGLKVTKFQGDNVKNESAREKKLEGGVTPSSACLGLTKAFQFLKSIISDMLIAYLIIWILKTKRIF